VSQKITSTSGSAAQTITYHIDLQNAAQNFKYNTGG
jgi:hypothetical protein